MIHLAPTDHGQQQYEAWRAQNPRSFVVSCKRGEWMLHRAGCSHLDQVHMTVADLMGSEKICCTDRAMLERNARAFGRDLVACSHCRP